MKSQCRPQPPASLWQCWTPTASIGPHEISLGRDNVLLRFYWPRPLQYSDCHLSSRARCDCFPARRAPHQRPARSIFTSTEHGEREGLTLGLERRSATTAIDISLSTGQQPIRHRAHWAVDTQWTTPRLPETTPYTKYMLRYVRLPVLHVAHLLKVVVLVHVAVCPVNGIL